MIYSHCKRTNSPHHYIHTYDILIHLLEAVKLLVHLEEVDCHDHEEEAPLGLLDYPRWQIAWEFLQSEEYVIWRLECANFHRLTLSEEGYELLEELHRCRINPQSSLFIHSNEIHDLYSDEVLTAQ